MAGVTLIVGEDDFLVAEAAKKVVGAGVGLELFDSNTATNASLQLAEIVKVEESFLTPPFFDPEKTTWWKNVNFLPHLGKGAPSEEVKTALEKFAEKIAASVLPENQRFLITASKLKMDSVFAKTLKGCAEIIEYKKGKGWAQQKEAVARAGEFAAAEGLVFAPGAAEKFVSVVGCDSRSLLSEVGKMRCYLGEKAKTIDEKAVEEISSPGVTDEPELWAVTDAVGARECDKAIAALRSFEREDGFVIRSLNAIERLFRQLCEMKDAAACGKLDAVTEGMAPFTVRKMQGFLGRWSLMELRRARRDFLLLREKAVTGGDSIAALIFTEVVRTCRRPVRRVAG